MKASVKALNAYEFSSFLVSLFYFLSNYYYDKDEKRKKKKRKKEKKKDKQKNETEIFTLCWGQDSSRCVSWYQRPHPPPTFAAD